MAQEQDTGKNDSTQGKYPNEKETKTPVSYRQMLETQEAQYQQVCQELTRVEGLKHNKAVLEGSMAMLKYIISQEEIDGK